MSTIYSTIYTHRGTLFAALLEQKVISHPAYAITFQTADKTKYTVTRTAKDQYTVKCDLRIILTGSRQQIITTYFPIV